jgi:uncharacterized protein YjbJ (UPF0337 family)
MCEALIGTRPVAGSPAGLRRKEPAVGLGKKAKDRAKIMKGKARKHVGKATGNKRLRAKGKATEVVGKIQLKGHKAKDAIKR